MLSLFSGESQNVAISPASTLSLKSFCPKPNNQEGLNACVGYALGYGAMTVSRNVKLKNKYQNRTSKYCFSPLFVFNQSLVDSFDCNKGASYHKSIEVLKEQGNCFISDFDVGNDCYAKADQQVKEKARANTIKSGGMIFDKSYSNDQKIERIKSFLLDSIPVVINFELYESFIHLDSGETNWTKQDQDAYKAHHGLLVVGFDATHFEVMNSWGTDWANGGFVKITHQEMACHALRGYVISFDSIAPDRMMKVNPNNEDVSGGNEPTSPVFTRPYGAILKSSMAISGKVTVNETIETVQGDLLSVGSIKGRKGSKLFIQSQQQEQDQSASDAMEWEDEFGISVVQLPDSSFIVGGYSMLKDDLQERKVWLNFYDQKIKKRKQKIIKKSVLPLTIETMQRDENQIVCVGIENKDLWIITTDFEGNFLSKKQRFRKKSKDYFFKSANLLMTKKGYFVYGTALILKGKKSLLPSDDDYKVPYLLRLNKQGDVVDQVVFLDLKISNTGNITEGYNKQLIMTGTLSGDDKGKYFFIRISKDLNKKGMVLTKKGSKGLNEGVFLLTLDNNELLVMGNTTAPKIGGRTFNVFLDKLDQYGNSLWNEPWTFGGKHQELGSQLIQKKNGEIWISATQEKDREQTSLLNLCVKKAEKNTVPITDLKKIIVSSNSINKKIQIAPDETYKLEYKIRNERNYAAANLKLELSCLTCPSLLDFKKQQDIKLLMTNHSKKLTGTIKAKKKSSPGSNEIRVRFLNQGNQIIFEEVITVEVFNRKLAPFELIGTAINSTEGTAFRPQEEAVLTISFCNKSKFSYRDVQLKIDLQENITINDPTAFIVDHWKANETKTFKLKLTAGKEFQPRLFEANAFIRFRKKILIPFLIKPELVQ